MTRSSNNIGQTTLIGTLAGFLSGLLGIGGGAVLVPALVYLAKLPQHTAQGTSLLVIILTAITGATSYYLSGNLDLGFTLWIAAGSMFGVLLGSFFAHKLHPMVLRKLFGLFLIIVAFKMFIG